MLIVCPTCATSYMIDPASVGQAGRAVRCARCRATWFVSPSKPSGPPSVSAFVDSVIAEAEAEEKSGQSPPPQSFDPPSAGVVPDIPDERFPRIEPSAFDSEPPPLNQPTAEYDAGFDANGLPAVSEAGHDAGEPVTISDAPPLAPPDDHSFAPGGNEFFHEPPASHEHDDGDDFAARRARMKAKRKVRSNKSRWTAVILVLLAANVALIGARSEIVRYLPQTASLFSTIGLPVNLRNLEFQGINISKEAQDGVTILIIDGRIVNTSNKAVDVPRLRFAARTATGQEVYTWTMQPPRSILGPGDSIPFTSRLAAPPAEAADVLVRFFTAQDAGRGLK